MDNYAYATYIDKKFFLPGLQGLYYSLLATGTKYDFIILYCGEITEEDIWQYIDKKQVVLYKIPNSYSLTKINKTNIDDINAYVKHHGHEELDSLYYGIQNSNSFNPLYIFSLINYKTIVYLHCDIIVLNNYDQIFKIDKKNYIAYCNGFYKNNTDASFIIFFPDMDIWNFILNNKYFVIKYCEFSNLDMIFGNDFLKKYFKIGVHFFNSPIKDNFMHYYGAIKYWTFFPNFNIKQAIKSKRWLKDNLFICNFMREKIIAFKENEPLKAYNWATEVFNLIKSKNQIAFNKVF